MRDTLKLNDIQVRILGSLIEKSMTAPDHYPLSLKSLQAACNQKTGRQPVVEYDEQTIVDQLQSMLEAELVDTPHEGKTFRHRLSHYPGFNKAELSVLHVLMLRGPHTASDLLQRTGHLFTFSGRDHVERILLTLANHDNVPCVIRLELQSSDCEHAWMQTFSYPRRMPSSQPELAFGTQPQSAQAMATSLPGLEEQLRELEAIVAELSAPPAFPARTDQNPAQE